MPLKSGVEECSRTCPKGMSAFIIIFVIVLFCPKSFQATKQPEMRCKLVNNLITSMVFVAYLAGTLTYGQEDTKHVATSSGILTSLSSEFEINTIYCNRAMCNTGEAARGTIFVPGKYFRQLLVGT